MPKSKERDEICGKFVRMLRRKIQIAGSILVKNIPYFMPSHRLLSFSPLSLSPSVVCVSPLSGLTSSAVERHFELESAP